MFRGIDPDGLCGLAKMVGLKSDAIRHQSRVALDILNRGGRSADVAAISSVFGWIDNWGIDASDTLRWRADTIRNGQGASFDVFAIARAEFATEAIFSISTVDESYRDWAAQRQASKKRVDGALADISNWLDQGWTDWDVTNNDLHNIWITLDGLSPQELDRVIADLSPAQLKRWIEEIGHSINGFSQAEKQQVFTMLASNSNGNSLGKVHDAIMSGGGEDAIDFGVAIQKAGADQAIVDFVTYTVSKDLGAHKYSGLAPALAVSGIDDGSAVDTALQSIIETEGALVLILADCLATTQNPGADTAPALESLISALSRETDLGLKIATFATVAGLATDDGVQLRRALGQRHGIGDTARVATATSMIRSAETQLLALGTGLLVSDANGIVQALATELDPAGSLTSAYFRELVDRERSDLVGAIVEALRGGSVVNQARFAEHGTESNYPYPHAQNLAFVAGSLNRAVSEIASEAKNDIHWIEIGAQLAGIAAGLGFAKILENVAIKVAAIDGAGGFLTNHVATETQNDIDGYLEDLIETIETSLRPPRPLEPGMVGVGDALYVWEDKYDLIRKWPARR